MSFTQGQHELKCSFCGKEQSKVRKLIAGPGPYICDECVVTCMEIIEDELKNTMDFEIGDVLRPIEMKTILDQYVIGQDLAKKVLSVAVYEHFKELKLNSEKNEDEVELQKGNILLIGESGSGKTLLAQTLARILDRPFAIADATTLTQAGYVGEDVENILLKLIQAADYDVEKAEKGIIFIDEIDKIGRKGENMSISRDVSGEGVQQALLKILEGTVASVPPQGGRKHPHQDFIQIDTTNILFICGGAFEGIESIIKQRYNKKELGFKASSTMNELDEKTLLTLIEPDDILKFGIIPELAGRLPIIAGLEKLDEEALIRILTEPKNSLVKQFKKRFKAEQKEIDFADAAVQLIAQKAIKRKAGARGLRSILEDILLDLRFEIPSRDDIESIYVTKEFVESKSYEDLIINQKDKTIA